MSLRKIEVRFTDEHAGFSRAHESDAGYDLRCLKKVWLEPYARVFVPTGVRVAIPEGYAGLVCSRSGLARSRGVCVLNDPGVIDPGYQGDVGVVLFNASDAPVSFDAGDRIAQLLIVPVATPLPIVVDAFDAPTERGMDGFGSTGV